MSFNRRLGLLFACLPSLLCTSVIAASSAPAKLVLAANEQVLNHGRFNKVHVYSPSGAPTSFALLLSGDGGWQKSMAKLAQALTAEGALVAGIDTPQFIKNLEADDGECVFPDGDLENLSHFVQAYAKAPAYLPPVLVGYSSGATLGYATVAQAPTGTFTASLLLGFCPDLDLQKPFCPGDGVAFTKRVDGKGVDFLPAPKIAAPLVALLGSKDPICDAQATQKFIAQIPAARQVILANVTHNYGGNPQAVTAFVAAYRSLAAALPAPVAPPSALGDLPIVEVPATKRPAGDRFAIFWSGDGGWAGIDKEVADALAAQGIDVVGVDSLRYFWTARTPEGIAADIDKIVRHYATHWRKKQAILIGYSQGADVLPFAINRLPPATRKMIALGVGMGLSDHAVFEFELSNWVSDNNNGPETLPEVKKITDIPFLCVYGEDEDDSICPKLVGTQVRTVKMAGGHHFGGDYEGLAATIISALPK